MSAATTAFFNIELASVAGVLRPRNETEILVEQALELIDQHNCRRIADWGCGSGALALALAANRPEVSVVACDASEAACTTAERNRQQLGLDQASVQHQSWANCTDCYDLIVSNPPYVTSALSQQLRADGTLDDPALALDGGEDGLDCFREIIPQARRCLNPGGWLACEHGVAQHERLAKLLAANGFDSIKSARDYQQLKRVIIARRA